MLKCDRHYAKTEHIAEKQTSKQKQEYLCCHRTYKSYGEMCSKQDK
jgi:hypothetical protein